MGLQRLIDLVGTFSSDIGMTFGIQKCAKLTIKRGKPVSTGPIVMRFKSCLMGKHIGT